MPLRHQPLDLKRAAMVTISRYFDLLCYSCKSNEEIRKLLNSEDYLRIDSPFKELPPHLVAELTEEMKHITHLRRHHLHALITSNLVRWSSYGVGDILTAFSLLPRCGKNLQVLNISYQRHLNPNTLINFIPTFTSLVSLNLKMTLIVDQMLEKIGENCPNLLDLNLSGTPITDRGAVLLCLSSNGDPRCQKLSRLVLNETWVTSSGAAILLLSLPQLRELDFERMFEVVEILSGWSEDMGESVLAALGLCSSRPPLPARSSLQLVTFTSSAEKPSENSASAAVSLCPCIVSLTFYGTSLKSEELYPFMVLQNLTSLSITNFKTGSNASMDFETGILPLLTVVGQQLKNLILSKFKSIDIIAIGKSCPNLINFALSEVAEFQPLHQINSEGLFENLLALELWADPYTVIPTNVLYQLLLFAPKVKNLLFKGVSILTDKVLLGIWKENPMKQLSHLTVDHCHGVTNAALQWLLDSENELTVLRIWSCCRITKEVKNQISHRILTENMDLYFEWFQLDD